jgi:hypothetical protein
MCIVRSPPHNEKAPPSLLGKPGVAGSHVATKKLHLLYFIGIIGTVTSWLESKQLILLAP